MKPNFHTTPLFILNKIMIALFTCFCFAVTASAQEYNRVETFTTANGLASLGCSDVLKEEDGTIWVTHTNYYQANMAYNKPISRRSPQGVWSHVSLTGIPIATVNGQNRNPESYVNFSKIFKASDGKIFFISKSSGTADIPLVVYENGSFTVWHHSLANFPNKGGVQDMAEDEDGNLWFGCIDGIIKRTPAGVNTSYNPPMVTVTTPSNTINYTARRVPSIDIDDQNNVVFIAQATNGSFVRRYRPAANQWDLWHLADAPWLNAAQGYYAPREIKASKDKENTVWVSTSGGGLYYIKNNDYASKERNQIANFLTPPLWGTWGWPMETIRTNLPDFNNKMLIDNHNNFWVFGTPGSSFTQGVYKYIRKTNTTYNGGPATRYMYGNRTSTFMYNNNGTQTRSSITGMSFASDNSEVWVACEHGLERWYSDYPFPVSGDFIGVQGSGVRKIGIAAFNTIVNNATEPAALAHVLPQGTPVNSIDSAYYYLSSSDYEGLDDAVNHGLMGDGTIQGFPALSAALQQHNLTPQDIKIKFTPVSLGNDISGTGEDWTYSMSTETRKYQKRIEVMNDETESEAKSNYEISINGALLFKGEMPAVHLGIGYNKYGYLFDSIAAHTDDVKLSRAQFITQQNAIDIADAIEQDLNGHGVKFVMQSIQSANDTSIRTNERTGGFFKINYAYLKKSDTAMVNGNPMSGIYRIGASQQAQFSTINNAIDSLHKKGVNSWVSFVIEDGVYNEQLKINAVPGTQYWNNRPITFRSISRDSTKVRIQFNAVNAAGNYVFNHGGIKNLKLKQLHFKSSSLQYGRILSFTGAPAGFVLENAILENSAAGLATIDNDLLHSSVYGLNNVIIKNNVFRNGFRSIYAVGSNMKILNNDFIGHNDYAVSFGNASSPQVIGNRIYGPSANMFYGINLGNASNNFVVANNKIVNTTAYGGIGINCSNSAQGGSYSEAEYGRVWNNEISMRAANITIGINAESSYTTYYHNSVSINGNDPLSVAIKTGLTTTTSKIENNIFSNANGYAMAVYRANGGYYPESNRNIYYSALHPFKIHTSTNNFTNYANVADLNTVSGRDASSVIANPEFMSAENLLPQNTAVYNSAVNIATLTTDIRNRPRPVANRDHGAYELNAWTGTMSSNWNTHANWSDNAVPDTSGLALFPANGVINELVLTQPQNMNSVYVANNRNITINANQELNITGVLHNDGIIGGAGSVSFIEANKQTISGNGRMRNLIINNPNGVEILNNKSSNKLSIDEKIAVLSGTLNTNDNLVLKSSVGRTARVAPVANGNIKGNVIVERYISAKRAYRALTAPLKGAENNSIHYNWQNNDVYVPGYGMEIWAPAPNGTADPSYSNSGLALGNDYSMFTYNNNMWTPVTNTNTTTLFDADKNKSYLALVSGDYISGIGNIASGGNATTLTAKGNLIIGTHSVNNLAQDEIHLIGNPYASSIDFTQLQRTNIQNKYWVWDPNRAGVDSLGGFVLFDVATGTTVPAVPVGSYNNYTNIIQSGQAFFVHADGGNGSITFNENAKSNDDQMVFRTNGGAIEKLNISLYRNKNGSPAFSDGITAVYDNDGEIAVNSQDAIKLSNIHDNIYFVRSSKNLMMERRPLVDDKDTLFISISNTVNANYEIKISAENFDVAANLTAELLDKYMGMSTTINLTANEVTHVFSVDADPASKGDRFMIVFKQAAVLPLRTIALKASPKQNTILLQWNTTGETAMNKYAVEKSTDGITYNKAYETPAQNTAAAQYSWTDTEPAEGVNYYRIQAVNKDGSYVYSNVERVNMKTENRFTVYPNPAKRGETVTIKADKVHQGKITVTLINADGKTVLNNIQTIANDRSTIALPDNLATGKYVLKITDAEQNVYHQSVMIY